MTEELYPVSESIEEGGEWISITQAAMILKQRYLKTRDLVSQGDLGEVRQTQSGRYYVRRSEVTKYAESQGVK